MYFKRFSFCLILATIFTIRTTLRCIDYEHTHTYTKRVITELDTVSKVRLFCTCIPCRAFRLPSISVLKIIKHPYQTYNEP